jgi:hypothetical protein
MLEVVDRRFDNTEWPISFQVPAAEAENWFEHLQFECERRGWSGVGMSQLQSRENSGSLMLLGAGLEKLSVVWDRARAAALNIRARPAADVDLADAQECFRRVNERSRTGATEPRYWWGILEYEGRAWRGELWLSDNLRLGPPTKQYEKASRGPRAVVVDAVVDCISQAQVPHIFRQLLAELAPFLSVVVAASFRQSRQGKVWTWAPTAEGTDCSVRHLGYMARLDRLGPKVKEIAQVGAAIGREFSYELLAATGQRSEMELREAVGRLVDAGLVFQRGNLPQATFLFKHALVQDAAHSTLLRSRRQELHARIARVIEQCFPERVDEQPEVLAYHYAQAGLAEHAIMYFARAGRRASDRSAMVEAASHLTKAIALISELPPTRQHARQELDLQTVLGRALTATKGYAAAETGGAYARARRLCEDLDDTRTLVRVGYGQYLYHLLRAEVSQSHRVAIEILSFAENAESDEARILGYRTLV